MLVATSYLFYGWADPFFCLLLFFTTSTDFLCALALSKAVTERARKLWLATGTVISLGVLFYFKYALFFLGIISDLTEKGGWSPYFVFILPAGISFYTFQSLGYLIDVYRRTTKPEGNFVTYLLYVSFFPQLVAGPIERAKSLLPQLHNLGRRSPEMVAAGARQILAGLILKIVVADNMAPFVDVVYNTPESYLALPLAVATAMFGVQIYCDFAGYSLIAIGTAKFMGIDLMRNFATPYFSKSLDEFWRRWHISLSTFFRDYIYIPLGGSKKGMVRTCLAIGLVFSLSGLWHGANWTFILWGLYHGLGLITLRLLRILARSLRHGAVILPTVLCVALTQIFVLIGWILFRSESIADATQILGRLISWSTYSNLQNHLIIAHWSAILIAISFLTWDFLTRKKEHILDFTISSYPVRIALYSACVVALFLFGSGTETRFIYFRF